MGVYHPDELLPGVLVPRDCTVEPSSESQSPFTGVVDRDKIPEAAPNIFVLRKGMPLLLSWKMRIERGPTKSRRRDVSEIEGRDGFLMGRVLEGSAPILDAMASFSSSETLSEKRAMGMSSSEAYQV